MLEFSNYYTGMMMARNKYIEADLKM